MPSLIQLNWENLIGLGMNMIVILMFSEDTSIAIPLENYTINLQQGWNMIGSPFAFPVRFEIDGTVESPWYYGTISIIKGWSQEEEFLKPWKGYAVYASEESDITLLPFSNSITSSNRFSDESWMVALKIESENFIHNVVKLGRLKNARVGKDRYDVPAPPDIENSISVLMDLVDSFIWIFKRYSWSSLMEYGILGSKRREKSPWICLLT